MLKLIVTNRTGTERTIEVAVGGSLMESLRDAGFDEVMALCGGCCSCATCHVHIDPNAPHRLPAMTEDENDLLESSSTRDASSRLSCQIPLTEALDGLRLTIAEQD